MLIEKTYQRGFTLIELLMVISIISLLSSMTIGGLRDAKEKARIASILQIDSTMRQAYANDLVAEWNFDSITLETSGYGGYDGQVFGTERYAGGIVGKAFDFDGNTRIEITPPQGSALRTLGNNESYTVSFWYKTSAKLVNNATIGPFGYQNTTWNISLDDSGRMNFTYLTTNAPPFTVQSSQITPFDLSDGRWHHVMFVKDLKNNQLRIYIDTQLIKSVSNWKNDMSGDGDIVIGFRSGLNYYAGLIDQFRIYQVAYPNE